MYEPEVQRASGAMQWLMDLLNADVDNDTALPAFLGSENQRDEAKRLQGWMEHTLAPILLTDPALVVAARTATWHALLQHAERRGQPEWELDSLRRRLNLNPAELKTALVREREQGIKTLATLLSEWAKGAQITPQWQVNPVEPDHASPVPVGQRYRCGEKVFSVIQWHPIPSSSPTAIGMMCLGACLVSGEFNRLRVCVQCGKYYYARDFRQKCCETPCYRARDGANAKTRMQRKRQADEHAIKEYFIATLPTLNIKKVRAWISRKVLPDWAMGAVEEMLKQLQDRQSSEKIWQRSSPRTHGLFRKIQKAQAGQS